MSGLTAWHSPLPDAKPRLELYVWSLIEDARRGRVCALIADERTSAAVGKERDRTVMLPLTPPN